jgi:glutathione S-transferase
MKLVVSGLYSAFVAPELDNHLSFLESQLATSPGGGDYLTGAHLTAGDILMIFPLVLARQKAGELSAGKGQQGKLADKYPKLWAYLKRLEESPSYKRAEAKVAELEKKAKETK